MSEARNILQKDWKLVKLGEVCTYSKGKKPVVLKVAKSNECSIPYINIKAFEKGIFDEYTNGEKCNLCKDNDLLMVWDGARCGLIGKAKKGAVGSTLMKILPKEIIHKEYLYHFINSKFWSLNTKSKGVGIPHIEPTLLWNFELVVPPLPEQQAIVAKIEELLSELDNGKQQLLTAQQQLKVYRQSLLKWAFEGKLTNKKVKDEELPDGWKWVKIEEIATVGTGATPLKGNSNYYNNGNIAWVTSGALNDEYVKEATDFVTELALKETNLSVYPKHTLLLAMYGEGKTRGKCSELLFDATTNQAIAAIHFKNHDERVRPYLKYFLLKNYNDIRMLSSGGVQPNLNLGIVKKTTLPIPPLKEQQLIVEELESKLTVCDKIEETIVQSLLQAETLRQSILKKAFEGRLV